MFDFSTDDIRILRETIRRVKEGLPIGGFPRSPTPAPRTTETAWVKLTSTTISAGRYPARRWYWDEETSAMVDTSEVVWADTPNGETLSSTSTYYAAQFTGILDADGLAVYQVVGQFSSGSTSPLTTKGDLWGYSTVDARLPVGTNNYVLTADSAQTLGVKWAAAPAPAMHGCRVYKATSQVISSPSGKVVFDTEYFDTDAYHDTATNNTRITIPSNLGGYYLIGACCQWDSVANDTDHAGIGIMLNNTQTLAKTYSNNAEDASAGAWAQCVSTVFNLSVGDYVEINAESDINRTIGAFSYHTPTFWAYLIGT